MPVTFEIHSVNESRRVIELTYRPDAQSSFVCELSPPDDLDLTDLAGVSRFVADFGETNYGSGRAGVVKRFPVPSQLVQHDHLYIPANPSVRIKTISVTFSSSVTAGNLIHADLTWSDEGSEPRDVPDNEQAVADDQGGVYTLLPKSGSAQNPATKFAYANEVAGGTTTVTWTNLNSPPNQGFLDIALDLAEISGCKTGDPLLGSQLIGDYSGGGVAIGGYPGPTNTTNPRLGASMTITHKAFLWFSYCNETENGDPYTVISPWQAIFGDPGHIDVHGYIESAAPGTYLAEFTSTSNVSAYSMGMIAYQDAQLPPPAPVAGGAPAQTRLPARGMLGTQFLDPGPLNVPERSGAMDPAPDLGPWHSWGQTFNMLLTFPGPPPVPSPTIRGRDIFDVDNGLPPAIPRSINPEPPPSILDEERENWRYLFPGPGGRR